MARNLTDTAEHLLRILQQGGVAADRLIEIISGGVATTEAALLKLVKSGATEQEALQMIRSLYGELSTEAEAQLVSDALKSGKYQAVSTAAYVSSLSGEQAAAYNVTRSYVRAVFREPFPGGGQSVRGLFTGLMAGLSLTTTRITTDAFIRGSTIRQISKLIQENLDLANIDATARRQSEALARTAISKVANSVREETYNNNDDIIERVMFSATLDHRTSAECMAHDGLWWYLKDPDLKRPPLHVNCRSTLIPILHGEDIRTVRKELSRPAVVPTEDFGDKGLKTRTGRVRKPSTKDGSPLRRVDGDNSVNYANWLKIQPEEYQKAILGQKAYGIYKETGDFRLAIGKSNISQSTWKPPTVTPKTPTTTATKTTTTRPVTPVAPPKKPEWNVPITEELSPEIGAFTEASFFDPKYAALLAKIDAPGWIKPIPGKTAYCSGRSIHMGEDSHVKNLYNQAVFRHEAGHHAEQRLGYLTATKEMNDLRKLDAKHIQKKWEEEFNQRVARDNARREQAGLSTFGKVEDIRDNRTYLRDVDTNAISAEFEKTNAPNFAKWVESQLKPDGIAMEMFKSIDISVLGEWERTFLSMLLNADRHGEMLSFITEFFNYGITYRAFNARWGSNGNLTDLLGSITLNKVGAGHSNDYYKKFDAKVKQDSPSSEPKTIAYRYYGNFGKERGTLVQRGQNTEAFANLFDLLHDAPNGIKFGRLLAELYAPNLSKYVLRYINE